MLKSSGMSTHQAAKMLRATQWPQRSCCWLESVRRVCALRWL